MIDTYGPIFRSVLFPLWETTIRHRPTLEYLASLNRTQWAGYSDLIRIQDEALRDLLQHAYENVPFYRERMRKAGLLPSKFRGQADLQVLPVLTREDAQASYEQRKSERPPLPEIYKMTSGTTGQPLAFGYDANSDHWRNAIKMRGYGWAGYRPGDETLFFWGSLDVLYPKGLKKRLKSFADHRLKREHYIDSCHRSDEALHRVFEYIDRERPKAIVCYAQGGASLARFAIEKGIPKTWGTIPVICGAERLFPADRKVIERVFGPAVFETYGSREFMLIGAECAAHQGMHTSMENLIVEVLVRKDASFVAAEPGEVGEIAITDLHNYGVPFIRYLTGDLGIWEAPERCRCGRELRRLRSIEGRQNDMLRDAAGNQVDSIFFPVLFSVLADKVKQFQAVQHKDGTVRLMIVPTSAFNDAVLTSIEKNCKTIFRGLPFQTEIVTQIPVDRNGKLRVIVAEH